MRYSVSLFLASGRDDLRWGRVHLDAEGAVLVLGGVRAVVLCGVLGHSYPDVAATVTGVSFAQGVKRALRKTGIQVLSVRDECTPAGVQGCVVHYERDSGPLADVATAVKGTASVNAVGARPRRE